MIKIFGIIITYDELFMMIFACSVLATIISFIVITIYTANIKDKQIKKYDINHKTIKDIKIRKEDKR